MMIRSGPPLPACALAKSLTAEVIRKTSQRFARLWTAYCRKRIGKSIRLIRRVGRIAGAQRGLARSLGPCRRPLAFHQRPIFPLRRAFVPPYISHADYEGSEYQLTLAQATLNPA